MKNTYLKPSAEIIRMETGAILEDKWNFSSIPGFGGAAGAKSRNPQGTDNASTDPNAPQDDVLAFPPSIWDD